MSLKAPGFINPIEPYKVVSWFQSLLFQMGQTCGRYGSGARGVSPTPRSAPGSFGEVGAGARCESSLTHSFERRLVSTFDLSSENLVSKFYPLSK
jgi:hypothetical protein